MNIAPSIPSSDAAWASSGPGSADLLRKGRKRLKATLLPFGVGMAMAAMAAAYGLAQWWQVGLLLAFTFTGLTCFYLLLSSGITARWRDPMLTFPQVLFGIVLVALSYAVMDIARALALEWLCLIIVFDMRRLPRRQTLIAAALAMALPALSVTLAEYWQPRQTRLTDELLFLLLSSGMVPVLLIVSAVARKLRARRQQNQAQMAEVLAQLQELSVRDGLTGLCNRRHMQSLLEEEVRRLQRSCRPFCVAILDIDWFKRVNDQRGHAMGDTVLRYFSAIGRAALQGRTDVLARWGGEEFLLLMPETTAAEASTVLHLMSAMVRSYNWGQHDAGLSITFSAGICEHGKSSDLTHTLEAADAALYRAKEAGRDRVETSVPVTEADTATAPASTHEVLQRIDTVPSYLAAASPVHASLDMTDGAQLSGPLAKRRTKSRRSLSRLTAWALGPDPEIQDALRMCLMVSSIYAALFISTIVYGIPSGMMSPAMGHLFMAIEFIGGTVPLVLVRSGITAKLRDRPLVVPQMIWGCLSAALAFVLVPPGRAYDLEVFCVVQIFGFINLRPRQAATVGLTAIGLLAVVFGTLFVYAPADFQPQREGLILAGAAFILSLLTLQSHNFALTRERSRQERRSLAAATEQVRELMIHDALTGLFNRQHTQHLLERECERHAHSGHSFCVALVDLDHFKRINDTLGHQIGDEALQGFARAAKSLLRETDVIGRWGGEEFLLLLVDTESGAGGMIAAERLRSHVAGEHLCPNAPDLVVTFSCGVAMREADETPAQFLERADRALYAAKSQGRNRCVLAESEAAVSS